MVSEKECQPKAGAGSSTAGAARAGNASPSDKLSPPATIKSGKRITEILKTGARASGRQMSLIWLCGGENGGLRLAILVPKRTGSAVKRNRIRRVLREEIRQARRPTGTATDAVLLWRPAITSETDERQAREEVRRLIKNLIPR